MNYTGFHGKDKRKGRPPHPIFSGLLVCASCKIKMYVHRNHHSYTCTSCSRKTTNKYLEPFLLERIRSFLNSEKGLSAVKQEAREIMRRHHEQSQALESRQLAIRAEQDGLHQLFRGRHLSGMEFQERNTPLYEAYQVISRERESLNAEVLLLQNSLQGASVMVEELVTFIDRWPAMDLLERRAGLESVVDQITLGIMVGLLSTSRVLATPPQSLLE